MSRDLLCLAVAATTFWCPPVTADQPDVRTKLTETPTWALRTLTAGGVERAVKEGERATLSFEKNEVTGNTGCNLLSGTYRAKPDGTLAFTETEVTERACEHMELEAKFLDVLETVRNFEVKQGVLVLSDGTAANRLEFAPLELTHLPLAGTQWKLTHFTESDEATASATTVLKGQPLTMTINDGRATGSAGCNRYFGGVTVAKEGGLKFGPLASTKRACLAEGVMQQESRYLATLSKMTKFTINENVLTLSNADGTLGLQFSGEKPE